jgi:hypothetical protein
MADTNEEINQGSVFIFLAMVIALLAIVPALLIRLVLYLLGFGHLGPVAGKRLQSFPSFLSSRLLTHGCQQVVSLLASRPDSAPLGSSVSCKALLWVDGALLWCRVLFVLSQLAVWFLSWSRRSWVVRERYLARTMRKPCIAALPVSLSNLSEMHA